LIVDPDGKRRCRIDYHMPEAPDAYGISWSQAVCVPQPLPPEGLQVGMPEPEEGVAQ
jgi:outer membrane usher protein